MGFPIEYCVDKYFYLLFDYLLMLDAQTSSHQTVFKRLLTKAKNVNKHRLMISLSSYANTCSAYIKDVLLSHIKLPQIKQNILHNPNTA